MGKFSQKVAVITGATSGIGAATAVAFADEEAKVVLIGRDKKRGGELEKKIKDMGGTALFICCDVSQLNDVEKASEQIASTYGAVDILFNNAGVMLPSMEIERMPAEDWQKTFDINVTGVFYVTKILKPLLLKSKGTIVNNASIAGLQHYISGRSYAYSASKAAVIQFSHQMAKNYGEDGIRVNCICPGIIETPILGDRDRALCAQRVPLGYLGRPEDVAKVVLFLASDDASYLTGVVLPVDGGASL